MPLGPSGVCSVVIIMSVEGTKGLRGALVDRTRELLVGPCPFSNMSKETIRLVKRTRAGMLRGLGESYRLSIGLDYPPIAPPMDDMI